MLVFEVHIIDFHNPSDSTEVTVNYKPEECSKATKKGDFVKYHYNASLMDGTSIDSTWVVWESPLTPFGSNITENLFQWRTASNQAPRSAWGELRADLSQTQILKRNRQSCERRLLIGCPCPSSWYLTPPLLQLLVPPVLKLNGYCDSDILTLSWYHKETQQQERYMLRYTVFVTKAPRIFPLFVTQTHSSFTFLKLHFYEAIS